MGERKNRKKETQKEMEKGGSVSRSDRSGSRRSRYCFFIRNKNAADNAQKSVQTAQSTTAKIGSISNTIVGTGNITMDDAQALYVPSGIQIAEVMVESGDHVAKGQTLATVDETSVLKAMKQIQEEILELDEKISECQESDEENTIESGVSGRVKLINASEGLRVTDVMLEKGSLMVLSLDGKMAVDLSMVTGVREGDTVIVVRTDGTQEEGEVEEVNVSINGSVEAVAPVSRTSVTVKSGYTSGTMSITGTTGGYAQIQDYGQCSERHTVLCLCKQRRDTGICKESRYGPPSGAPEK